MLLLIPNTDVRKVYTLFKQLTTDTYSCISQAGKLKIVSPCARDLKQNLNN